jgi:hypothetical protein
MARRIEEAHRERWLKLPRALDATPARRQAARRQFSRNMANHLIWEAGRSLKGGHLLSARQSLMAALHLHPLGVAHRATRPSNLRFLLAHGLGWPRERRT